MGASCSRQEEMSNATKIVVRKPEDKACLGNLGMNGSI